MPTTYQDAISEIKFLRRQLAEQEIRHIANEHSFAKLEIELAHAKMDYWGMRLNQGHINLNKAKDAEKAFYAAADKISREFGEADFENRRR